LIGTYDADAPDGGFRVTPNRADFKHRMEAAEKVITRYRNTLRELTK
jgi:hypothetical protein